MKMRYYILILLSGLLPGLISCSDNEETIQEAEGFLDIGLSVEKQYEITTRSTGSIVDTFVVEITNVEDQVVKSFDYYYELKENGTLRLPQGMYTVTAHSFGEMEEISDSPYYGGAETFEVQPNVFTEAKVICSMQNAKIRIVLSDELASNVADHYTITLSVGGVEHSYYYDDFINNGVSADWYFTPSGTVSLLMEGTTTTGDDFQFEDYVDGGVNANDFLTIHLGLKSKATRSLDTDGEFNITLLTTK